MVGLPSLDTRISHGAPDESRWVWAAPLRQVHFPLARGAIMSKTSRIMESSATESIHGHEVIHMIAEAGRAWSRPPETHDAPAMHDKILILDFGSQVTQLIARRVREAHVYCEIHPNDVSDAFIRDFAPKGIILSGSHASTYEEHELRAPQAVWDLGVPVLGICYGMFTMAVQQGGQVEAIEARFGVEARFHTCSAEGLTADGIVRFLIDRGKFFGDERSLALDPSQVCQH